MITYNENNMFERTALKEDLAVSFNVLYCIMSIMLITYFKDMYFTLIMFVFELGYLSTHKRLSYKEIVTAIVICCFNFGAMIFTWRKNKSAVFGKDETSDLIKSLEMNHKNQDSELKI